MKRFALKNPLVFGLIIFLIIFVSGSGAGVLLGLLFMSYNTCEPVNINDPCHGDAMAAGMIWSMSFTTSLVLALIVAASSYIGIRILGKRSSN